MKNLSILLSAALMIIFTSCEKVVGEGGLVNETRTTASFAGVASELSANIAYVQGNDYKVELTAQQNILNVIETPVLNNELVVRFKNNVRVKSHEQITIKVTAPSISSVSLSGSGNVDVLSPLSANDLSLRVSGSGNIFAPSVTCSHLGVNISGTGNISINAGAADNENLKISGSGGIDVRNVVAKSVTTTTSGSGNMKVNVSESLNVTISGSGSVYYWGTPVVNTKISGSGKVIHQ